MKERFKERNDEIRARRAADMLPAEICRVMNLTRKTVLSVLERAENRTWCNPDYRADGVRCMGHYTADEDATIVSMVLHGKKANAIAEVIDRSAGSIGGRICKLRREGVLPRFRPNQIIGTGSIDFSPPVTLRFDDDLVRACLAEGGFPCRFVTSYGVILANQDGSLWRHTPEPERRAA